MPRDKSLNHAKLMAAAKEEFLALGFEKASMRSIGDRCGLTAAAIYRHCRNKEDLFDRLVSPAAAKIEAWLAGHVERYADTVRSGGKLRWQDSEADMMREIVYPDMEAYHLLLAKAQGTKYANYLRDLTERHRQEMENWFSLLRAQGYEVRRISSGELHLLLTAYTTALFEPVVRNDSQEEALRCLETVEAFFLPGWKSLMGF